MLVKLKPYKFNRFIRVLQGVKIPIYVYANHRITLANITYYHLLCLFQLPRRGLAVLTTTPLKETHARYRMSGVTKRILIYV
jgi:hypothetical protein